jgi:hypothetical protein
MAVEVRPEWGWSALTEEHLGTAPITWAWGARAIVERCPPPRSTRGFGARPGAAQRRPRVFRLDIPAGRAERVGDVPDLEFLVVVDAVLDAAGELHEDGITRSGRVIPLELSGLPAHLAGVRAWARFAGGYCYLAVAA